jgi:hypothetical protein
MMKLNGWKRIGILASVVWILGAGFYTLSVEENRNLSIASMMNRGCDNEPAVSQALCFKVGDDYVMRMIPAERRSAAFVALVPVPLGWGFTYLVLFLMRWVKRGFMRPL